VLAAISRAVRARLSLAYAEGKAASGQTGLVVAQTLKAGFPKIREFWNFNKLQQGKKFLSTTF